MSEQQRPTFTGELTCPTEKVAEFRRAMIDRTPIVIQFPNGRRGRALITGIRPGPDGAVLSLAGLDSAMPWVDPAAN